MENNITDKCSKRDELTLSRIQVQHACIQFDKICGIHRSANAYSSLNPFNDDENQFSSDRICQEAFDYMYNNPVSREAAIEVLLIKREKHNSYKGKNNTIVQPDSTMQNERLDILESRMDKFDEKIDKILNAFNL